MNLYRGRDLKVHTRQEWEVGIKVDVGFIKGLTVTGYVETPGDGRPNIWTLVNEKTGAMYEFQPHCGLVRVN